MQIYSVSINTSQMQIYGVSINTSQMQIYGVSANYKPNANFRFIYKSNLTAILKYYLSCLKVGGIHIGESFRVRTTHAGLHHFIDKAYIVCDGFCYVLRAYHAVLSVTRRRICESSCEPSALQRVRNVNRKHSALYPAKTAEKSSENTDGTVYWYSPIGARSINIDGYQEAWKRLTDQVGETAAFDLIGKTIFTQPVTIMAVNSVQEEYVEFSDHIITADWSVTADSLCKQHLLATMPKEKNTMLLYNVFSDYLIFGGSREVAEIPWSSVEILTRYDSANEIEDLEEWSEYIESSNLFSELFSYKANLLGENFVLKAVYQYLKKSAPECNQIEFLYRLGE